MGRPVPRRIPAIRRDTVKVLRGIDPRYTIEAAEKLRDFDRPALLAWAVEDRFFKLSFAERLAETIRGATLERIEDSYTFVSEDQPERLAELIAGFARERAPPVRSSAVERALQTDGPARRARSPPPPAWSPELAWAELARIGGFASRPTFLPRR